MTISSPTATPRAPLSLLMLCVLVGCGVERRGIGAFDGGSGGAGGSGGDAPAGAEVGAGGQGGPGALGSACQSAGECMSGFCVDGVCCNSSCLAICEACAERGSAGTCVPVAGAPRGSRPDCEGKATLCGGVCDGVIGSSCRYPAAETECAAAACKNGQAVSRSVCSGSGICLPGVNVSCAPFTCAGDVCAAGCTAERPCGQGHYCSGGRCLPRQGSGTTCADAEQCESGFCVDGRCCGKAACASCEACTGEGGTCAKLVSVQDPDSCTGTEACDSEARCRKQNGEVCSAASECVSGQCQGGRCCNRACGGPCESCSVPGMVGTCGTISFSADPQNCGACGRVCSASQATPMCVAGQCVGACNPGFADCNGNKASDGCETNVSSDVRHCGGCGVACPGTMCQSGACEKIQFEWSYIGPIPNRICVLVNEPLDLFGGSGDNHLCMQRDFGFRWSISGAIDGMVCTAINEGRASAWSDNFLCAPVDYGLRFSTTGPIAQMRCTALREPSDASDWNQSYLCAPL